jgi:hypothetical protein
VTLETLLNECALRGVTLARDGDGLTFEGPDDALTPELLDALVEHKTSVVVGLAWLDDPTAGGNHPPPGWRCPPEHVAEAREILEGYLAEGAPPDLARDMARHELWARLRARAPQARAA